MTAIQHLRLRYVSADPMPAIIQRLSLFLLLIAACLARLALPTHLGAQATWSTSVSTISDAVAGDTAKYRNPGTARRLGLVPGLGHMYAGEGMRGLSLWIGTVGAFGLGVAVLQLDNCTFQYFSPCERHPAPFQVLGTLLLIAGSAGWVVSIVDAPRAAERTNRRNGTEAPQVTLSIAGGAAWLIGLRLTLE